jgi:hypothetical protein
MHQLQGDNNDVLAALKAKMENQRKIFQIFLK